MKYDRLTSPTAISDALSKLSKRVSRIETKGTGTISFIDQATGEETIIGILPDGSTGVEQFIGDTTPPPVATMPMVSATPGSFIVTWDGLFVNGAVKPRDFVHVNVIGHKMNDTVTEYSTTVGVIRLSSEAVIVSTDIALGGESWQFSLESEDYNGNVAIEGTRSASVMMIDALSVVDEAWTDLKSDLALTDKASKDAQKAAADAQAAADRAQAGAINVVTDPSFETTKWPTDSKKTFDTVEKHTGTRSYKLAAGICGEVLRTELVPVSVGQVWRRRVWYKTDAAYNGTSSIGKMRLGDQNGALLGADVFLPNVTTWTLLEAEYTVPAGVGGIYLTVGADHTAGTLWIDDVELSNITDYKAAKLRADQAFNKADAAAISAGQAQIAADGKATVWYTDTAPAGTGHRVGDSWFDKANGNRLSTWDGTAWTTMQDAWLAQQVAESKGRVYTQNVAPPVAARLSQNLWIDTSLGVNLSVTKFWDATANSGAGAWVPVKDQEINAAELRAAADAKAKADAAASAAINAQAYTTNPSFDDWTGSAPTGYANYNVGPTKETTIFKRGPYAARFNCTDTTTNRGLSFSGIFTNAPDIEYWTVQVSFQLVSGTSLSGAGVRLDWAGQTVPAGAQPTLQLINEVPSPIAGKWYTVTKTLRKAANTTGTYTGMTGYLFANYNANGLGVLSVKDIIFDWFDIRPASVSEILAYTAPTVAYVDQAEADAISTAATDATTKANNAKAEAIADTTTKLVGKNKVVWSTSPATGTSGYVAGDVWFQRDGTNTVIGQWEFTTSWQPRTIGDAVLGNISAGKIVSGFIDSARIEAGSIGVEKLMVGSLDNLLPNGGFEYDLKGWGNIPSTFTIDATVGHLSSKSLKVTGITARVLGPVSTDMIPLGTNDSFRLAGWVKTSATTGHIGEICLYYSDASKAYLSNTSKSITNATSAWQYNNWLIQPPANAAYVTVRVNATLASAADTYWFDDLSVTRAAMGELIVDGAIDGKTITGPTIQTEVAANRGIKLTANEFAGYDTSGNKNFSLTSSGTLTLKGSLQSGSTIAGATITGALETTATASRGVKLSNTGIKAYDGSGNLTFTVDASTGEVEAPGLKANSITGDKIVSGSVTAEKIRIGDFTNLVTNGYGDLGAGIGFGANLIYDTVDKPSSVTGVFETTAGQGTYTPPSIFFDVNPNTEYTTEIWLKADLPNSRIYIDLRDQAGAQGTSNILLDTGASQGVYPLNNFAVPTVWTKYTIKTTTTATATKLRIGSIYFNHTNGTERGATVSMAVSIRRRVQGNLLVDGAITTNHMASGTIDAAVLSAGSITTPKLAAKSIGVDKLMVTSTDNLLMEGDFGNKGTSWQLSGFNTINATAGRGSMPAMRITATTTTVTFLNLNNKITIGADYRFRGSMWVKTTAAAVADSYKIVGRFYSTATAYTDIVIASSPALVANVWTNVEGIVPATIPSNTIAAEFYLSAKNAATGTITDIDFASVTRAADGALIVDGAITAGKLKADLVLATDIIAGDPVQGHARMTPSGFRVLAPVDGGTPSDVIRMGTSNGTDVIQVVGPDGTQKAGISSVGDVTGQTISADVDVTVDGKSLLDMINALPKGIIGWQQFPVPSGGWPTLGSAGGEVGLFEIGWETPETEARMYAVNVPSLLIKSLSGSTGRHGLVMRYTTDGTTPSIPGNSQIVARSYSSGVPAGDYATASFNDVLISSKNGPNIRILVSLIATVGSSVDGTIIEVSVEDKGLLQPITGSVSTGGVTPVNTTATVPPANPVVTKTVTYSSTSVQSFLGNNAQYNYNAGKGYQGLQPGTGNGNLKSLWDFPLLTGTLTGATVNKIEAYFYFEHWYNGSGGTAQIVLHGNTSPNQPATYSDLGPSPTGTDAIKSYNWPRGAGRWVTIPSKHYAGFKSGTYKGFGLIGDGTYNTYGIASSAKIRVTYTK